MGLYVHIHLFMCGYEYCIYHLSIVFTMACNAGEPGLIPGLGDHLEKEMATPSSILAWEIPWTEKPGRLQSMGLQRVGQD